jgi:phenylalanine-4-hydroxylase
MAVGARITSVYGGVADREALQLHKPAPATRSMEVQQDAGLMSLYALADELRRGDQAVNESVQQTLQSGLESYPDEWLLHAELLTLGNDGLRQRARVGLETLAQRRPDLAALIEMSLAPAQ